MTDEELEKNPTGICEKNKKLAIERMHLIYTMKDEYNAKAKQYLAEKHLQEQRV